MALTKTSLAEIEQQIQSMQRQRVFWQTNYFRQPLTGSQYWMSATERSLVFLTEDLDFFRLYYLTSDLPELKALMLALPLPGMTVTAYLTRQVVPELDAAFQDAGHKPYAVFRRMSCRSLRECKTNSRLQFATQNDVDDLLQRLQTNFAPGYADHLPSRAMLADYVRQRWVLVSRRDGVIAGYLVFQIAGKQVVYNYSFNASDDPSDFLLLQDNFYGLVAAQGIRSGILWVNEKNTRVITMHQFFSWKMDGLMSQYYVYNPTT
jgi:hypothetical protein